MHSEVPIPTSIKDLYSLSSRIQSTRSRIVARIASGLSPDSSDRDFLRAALDALQNIEQKNGQFLLSVNGKKIGLELDYEISELQKDLAFLDQGEDPFLEVLAQGSENFHEQVRNGVALLSGRNYRCFVTDRDGTTNNYCGRYRSSIQPAWNGVFLSRFARAKTSFPVIVTSGPLQNPGILDVSVNPEGSFIYAASKGREFLDLQGKIHTYPIEEQKQAILDRLNEKLTELLERPEYEKFGLIGSGLQFKFGQTTVARQDISGSVPEEESQSFLRTLSELVSEVDPEHENFRIEDTGMDVEIILTIQTEEGGLKDFDKGDGVRYLDSQLSMDVSSGPNLICGDTHSDLAMLQAAVAQTDDTWGVFVTRKDDLAARVHKICSRSIIVSEPDVLVAILRTLASQ